MNPDIKALWVAALRSGEYEQGKGLLRQQIGDDDSRWCCFGVLCDLAVKAGVPVEVSFLVSDDEEEPVGSQRWFYDGDDAFPPERVRQWAGLPSDCGMVEVAVVDPTLSGLAYHNDIGATFAHIADAIESQL